MCPDLDTIWLHTGMHPRGWEVSDMATTPPESGFLETPPEERDPDSNPAGPAPAIPADDEELEDDDGFEDDEDDEDPEDDEPFETDSD